MPKKFKWPGVLNEPIEFKIPGLLGPNEEELAKERSDQFRARLKALFEFCNVTVATPNHWQAIAMHLAAICIPGFSARPATGKKRGPWKDSKGIELYADVQWVSRTSNLSERSACAHLCSAQRFKVRYAGMKSASLWRRYQEVKKQHWFLTPFLATAYDDPELAINSVIYHFALFGQTN